MKRHLIRGWSGLALAALVAAGSAAQAKDLPKFDISDREVNRNSQGVSYAPVIKKVTPSVVTIQSTRTINPRDERDGYSQEDLLRRFFGGGGSPYGQRRGQQPRKQTQEGLGSGVIVSEDGYILTNNHVVEGADEDGVKVALADGTTKYDAKVIGKDPRTDIAVLKIEAKNLPAITIANSDKLEVGDVVLAIGNPFNVGQSVTMGIISAVGRGGFGITDYEDFIQTDAAINPGNSGGALVDAEGRLIGINQSIVSRTGGNNGIGFAVPINIARTVMEQLTTSGKISRGFLGVSLQPITPDLAKAFKLPDQTGALVGDVVPGTPAASAGLKEGDVVLEVDGKKISDTRHLRLMIAQMQPKTKVNIKLMRAGKEKNVAVTLGVLPGEQMADANDDGNSNPDAKSEQLEGVEVTDLDANARQQLDIPRRIQGALVSQVAPDSKAAEAGLRAGDVIVQINHKAVTSADDAVKLSEQPTDGTTLLRVYSPANGQGTMRYLTVEATKKK